MLDNKAHIIDRRKFGDRVDDVEAKLTEAIPIYLEITGLLLDKKKQNDIEECNNVYL